MIQQRCSGCNRLLFIQNGLIKQLKTNDKIEYNFEGKLTIVCKCKTINKF